VVREMAAAKLTAPEVAVEHFAFGSKEEFYIEHLKFKKDAEDKMIFPKKVAGEASSGTKSAPCSLPFAPLLIPCVTTPL